MVEETRETNSPSCDERIGDFFFDKNGNEIKNLPVGELNPGLPRDRRGYSPLYYRGTDMWMILFNRLDLSRV